MSKMWSQGASIGGFGASTTRATLGRPGNINPRPRGRGCMCTAITSTPHRREATDTERRQLVLTSSGPAGRAEAFARSYRGSVVAPELPEDDATLDPALRNAPVIYIESQYEHMDMVRTRKVIPILLKLTPLAD